MTYVITAPCVGTKDNACLDVCPVDCIHPTPDEPGYAEAAQLYIDPEECIDCDACADACPVDAPLPVGSVPDEWVSSIAENEAHFAPNADQSQES